MKKNNGLLYDITTECYEIPTILQREFSLLSGISLEWLNRIKFSYNYYFIVALTYFTSPGVIAIALLPKLLRT